MKAMKFPIKHIVLHTAAFSGRTDEEMINSWHIKRGFDMDGYHFVITGSVFDDKVEIQKGRPLDYKGAHTWGFNNSIGICITGNGDLYNWYGLQYKVLCSFCQFLMQTYKIPIENILGHRETRYQKLNPTKTCPGTKINMNKVRNDIEKIPANLFHKFYEGLIINGTFTEENST